MSGLSSFTVRVLIVAAIVAALFVVGAFVWVGVPILLMAFAGILFATALRVPANWLSRHTFLSPGWALLLYVISVALAAGIGIWLMAPQVVVQVEELVKNLPRSIQHLREQMERHPVGSFLWNDVLQAAEEMVTPEKLMRQSGKIFMTMAGGVLGLAVFLFVGFYLAAKPEDYLDGLVQLVPPGRRTRARQVLMAQGRALWKWMLGRALGMAVVTILTAVGLALMGMPLALALGLLAGLLTFVPNIGPIIAAVPAVLLALMQSPTLTLYVVFLYIGVQMVDNYVVMPLTQERLVALPPALTVVVQILAGLLLGGLGLLLAVPLLACTLVMIRMLYLEDTLGEET